MTDQPVLCLIHGHGVDPSIWDGLYAELSSDVQIVKPDLSTLTNHNTIEAYAEHVYSLLQTAQVEQVVLIGHSMGGYIALALAEKHPEIVKGLGLFHSTAFADDEARKQKRLQAIESLEKEGSQPFIKGVIPTMFADENQEKMADTIQTLVGKGNKLPSEALKAGVQAMLARPDRTHILKEATFPVLIIAGRHDKLVLIEKSEQLFDMPKKVQTTVLEHSGHLGMLEEPEEATNAIRRFLIKVMAV